MTTLTRKRLRVDPQVPQRVQRKSKQRASSTIERVPLLCIPASICADPSSHDMSPRGIELLGLISSLCRMQNAVDNQASAYEHGGKVIKHTVRENAEFKRAWKQVKRDRRRGLEPGEAPAPQAPKVLGRRILNGFSYDETGYKAGNIQKSIDIAGHTAYRHHLTINRQSVPASTLITTSYYKLLDYLGKSKCKQNYEALEAELALLCEPIRLRNRWRPLISSVERDGQRLLITVSGAIPNEQYHMVAAPLPTKSAPALAVLLWTYSIGGLKDEQSIKYASNYAEFCKRMFNCKHGWRATEIMGRVIDQLNVNWLPMIDKKQLHELKVKRLTMPPDRIKVVAEDDKFKMAGLIKGTHAYDQDTGNHHKRERDRERLEDEAELMPPAQDERLRDLRRRVASWEFP